MFSGLSRDDAQRTGTGGIDQLFRIREKRANACAIGSVATDNKAGLFATRLAFSVLEKLSHSERLARQARNSSRSAFFKKLLSIVTLRQQSRNKGVGAAGRGLGLQQTHTSDESPVAIRD
jgi:hypothetical protein